MKSVVFTLTICCYTLLSVFTGSKVQAQDLGVSYSYYFPDNGHFSAPISPLSFKGLGFTINKVVKISTGFSLYRISGMQVQGLPFETPDPIAGPFTSLFIPLEGGLKFKIASSEIEINAGYMFYLNYRNRLLTGNFDRAIRAHEQWDVVNSDVVFNTNHGGGFIWGAAYTYYIKGNFGITVGANRLSGRADFPIRGSYTGGVNGQPLETKTVDYTDAELDYSGWEFVIGAVF